MSKGLLGGAGWWWICFGMAGGCGYILAGGGW